MGPRSCERGNAFIWFFSFPSSNASMGPRSCERGNHAGEAADRHSFRSFNGAALVRARKLRHTKNKNAFVHELQWGRARASAEMGMLTFCYGMLILASMGPRSCERGNKGNAPLPSFFCWLQWGRARASAEICA